MYSIGKQKDCSIKLTWSFHKEPLQLQLDSNPEPLSS